MPYDEEWGNSWHPKDAQSSSRSFARVFELEVPEALLEIDAVETIQRFGWCVDGSARLLPAKVRRAAAAGTSPWREIASRAEALFGDDSGLITWWRFPTPASSGACSPRCRVATCTATIGYAVSGRSTVSRSVSLARRS